MNKPLGKRVVPLLLILGAATVAAFGTNVLLGRELAEADFGKFRFINALVVLLSSVLVLGQDQVIVRILARPDYADYRWPSYLLRFFIISLALAAPIVFLVGHFYDILDLLIPVYLAFTSAVGLNYSCAVVRARGMFVWGMFLSRSFTLFLFSAVVALFLVFRNIGLGLLVHLFWISWAAGFLLAVMTLRGVGRGVRPVPGIRIREGAWLFLIYITFMLVENGSHFFIARMLSYEALAGFAVILILTRAFDLVAFALHFLLTPLYARDSGRSLRRDTLFALASAGLITLGYLIAGEFLLHLLFDGKFDQYSVLLPFAYITGFCRVLYSVPGAIISARHDEHHLKIFVVFCAVTLMFFVFGNLWIIPARGVAGAFVILAAAWATRLGSAYFVVLREHAGKKQRD